MLLYVAGVLDPRYKMKYVAFLLKKLYSDYEVKTIMSSIKTCVTKLMHQYATNDVKLQTTERNQCGTSQ